jgi:hypothetical protein
MIDEYIHYYENVSGLFKQWMLVLLSCCLYSNFKGYIGIWEPPPLLLLIFVVYG